MQLSAFTIQTLHSENIELLTDYFLVIHFLLSFSQMPARVMFVGSSLEVEAFMVLFHMSCFLLSDAFVFHELSC